MRAPTVPTLLATLVAACLVLSGCAAGAPSGGSPSPMPSGPMPSGPAPTGSPSPILDAQGAAAAVAAASPLFDGIERRDPKVIGQASWWEATPLEAAKPPVDWSVTFTIGWGDCPSGCIDEHTWTYRVAADGSVTLESDTGSPLASDVLATRAAAATWTGVGGLVTAGPTCPVERPGESACAPRPVQGARLQVKGAGGTTMGQVDTDLSGLFRLELQPGDYTLEPQPVEGLMGTAAAQPFTVTAGAETFIQIDYDTGIR